jgi:hypothetical protein
MDRQECLSYFTMRLYGIISYICTLPGLGAGPAGRASVVRLTADSDAIVVGSVEAIAANRTISAIIHADRVLKGSIREGSTVPVTWTLPENAFGYGKGGASSSRGHGIFFLRRAASGSWSILPATNGDASWVDTYIPAPQNVPQALRDVASASLPPKASVLDHVLLEMVIAAEAGAPLPYDLVAVFRGSRSPVLAAAFRRFLSKQDTWLVSTGLRGSILSGDPSSVFAIRQKYAKLSTSEGWIPLLDEIKVYYLNTAPQAIRKLGQIATDNTVGADLRIAVAAALARMHTRQSLPYLAQLLGDQNGTLGAMAVGGLSSFANNVPIGEHEPAPGTWSYRTEATITHSVFDESAVNQRKAYYMEFWKDWWKRNQATLSRSD